MPPPCVSSGRNVEILLNLPTDLSELKCPACLRLSSLEKYLSSPSVSGGLNHSTPVSIRRYYQPKCQNQQGHMSKVKWWLFAFPIQNDFQMFSSTGETFTLSPLRRSGSYADQYMLPPIALRKYLGSELKHLAHLAWRRSSSGRIEKKKHLLSKSCFIGGFAAMVQMDYDYVCILLLIRLSTLSYTLYTVICYILYCTIWNILYDVWCVLNAMSLTLYFK